MVIAAVQKTTEEAAARLRGRWRARAAATEATKAKAWAWVSAKITTTTIGTSIKGSTVLTQVITARNVATTTTTTIARTPTMALQNMATALGRVGKARR